MGFLSKLFLKKSNNDLNNRSREYQQVVEFNRLFNCLLNNDIYIARSDYKFLIDKFKTTFVFFANCVQAQTLSYYCKKNKTDENVIKTFITTYNDISDLSKGSKLIDIHNDRYVKSHLISEKVYLDNILREVDYNIKLDEEQRKAILSDEDYSLIIAGAGAGKTTTVAAKVRYLVEKKHILPEQILVISFTNKAVGELKERINDGLLIPCPISTFHSAGYAILRKQEDTKKHIVGEGFLYNTINNYLKSTVLEKPELVNKLIMFFGVYFDAPYEGEDINLFFNHISKSDFSTLKSNLHEYNARIIDRRTKQITTITNETLRSKQEVKIANFLYLNSIDYEYEAPYQYHILKAKKPYTPDFTIKQGQKIAYIEHFGITEDGKHSFYSIEALEKYKKAINEKIALHKKHGTKLIYTFSKYNDGRDLLDHLKEQLIANGFTLQPRNTTEIFNKLIDAEETKYIAKLVKLICLFINGFKTNGYSIDDYYRFERGTSNVRTKLFLEIFRECYLEYQKNLSETNSIDFQDMINDSARILREKEFSKEKLDYKYIIVDEYQDISRQRFDLTKELSKLCDAKIIAVGDDWQSIYAFSGSNITLFTHFCSIMGYGKELKITNTYRNAQEVIDIAGNFIQKNESQIKKSLVSSKRIQKPVIIETYSEDFDKAEFQGKGGKYYHLGKQVVTVIGQILQANLTEGKSKQSTILLIGRYGFDARNLCFSNDFVYDETNNRIFCKKYKYAKLEFLTAHSSKGLGYDNVIIINARNELYGFPSKVDNDPIMQYVIHDDKSIEYAEERRLFYVAMTRTKNRVYIVTPEQRPSVFILELIKDYPNITVLGNLNKNNITNNGKIKTCPVCGYPLRLHYNRNYGLKLWICTNEPEVCSFITNDLYGGIMSVKKCDKCKDGYLIVKKGSIGPVLGCTNYKSDGTGCDRLMSLEYYTRWLTDEFEDDLSINKPSYLEKPEHIISQIKKSESNKVSQSVRKTPEIHKVEYKEQYVEDEGFTILMDNDGNTLTDIKLLKFLKTLRSEIALKEHKSAYAIVSNKVLVSLATYKPTNKDEFVRLFGLGETTYSLYGKLFINAIINYKN